MKAPGGNSTATPPVVRTRLPVSTTASPATVTRRTPAGPPARPARARQPPAAGRLRQRRKLLPRVRRQRLATIIERHVEALIEPRDEEAPASTLRHGNDRHLAQAIHAAGDGRIEDWAFGKIDERVASFLAEADDRLYPAPHDPEIGTASRIEPDTPQGRDLRRNTPLPKS